jgi:hypothetical protein
LCLSCSSRRIARELGVHSRTSYRWCWWLRNTAVSYETDRKLEGTVEADDLYHTAGCKGQAPGGGKKSLGRRARGRRKKREPGQTPPRHPCHQWELKLTGASWEKSPLGTRHFPPYTYPMYYML